MDLMTKVRKAVAVDGPFFLNVLLPCTRGWRYEPAQTVALSKLAVDTCVWSLYEVENGVWKLNHRPNPRKPITEWLRSQGRFAHLLRSENEALVEQLQAEIDDAWKRLQRRCAVGEPL